MPGNARLFSIKMLRKYAGCLCKVSSGLAAREFTGGIYTLQYLFQDLLGGESRGPTALSLLSPVRNLYVSQHHHQLVCGRSRNSDGTAVNKCYFLHLQKIQIRFYARRHQPFRAIKR